MNNKITILECSSNLSIGGIERAMQEFAIGLNKLNNYNVIVGANDIKGPRKEILEKAGIKVIQINSEDNSQILKKYKIDIIHLHGANPTSFKNIKIIKEVVFGNMYDDNADLNIFISNSLYCKFSNYHKKDFPNFQKKSTVLCYPQNVENWNKLKLSQKEKLEIKKKYNISKEDLVLGRMGRAEPSKTDFLLFFSTFKILKKHKNIKFIFMGLPLLHRIILTLNPITKNKIIFLPQNSDDSQIAKFFESIDIFWHTASRGETFGNVNAEAMIFKKPVITHYLEINDKNKNYTDNAQCEVVTHNKTGLVASYPKDILSAVEFFLNNRKKIKEFGENGYKKVNKLYSSNVIIKEFDKIIKEVLNGNFKTRKNLFEKMYKNFSKNQINTETNLNKTFYLIIKKFYLIIEFFYLVIRKIIRVTIKKNIEEITFNYFKER